MRKAKAIAIAFELPFPLISASIFNMRSCIGALVIAFCACTLSKATSKPHRGADSPTAPVQVEIPQPPPMRYTPGMEEPLVATGPVSDAESKDLDFALAAFHDAPAKSAPGADYDDYAQPLLKFIDSHPQSNWNSALYTNLGFGYYHAGYYSRTFTYLDKAWHLGRNATAPQARLMIDRAVGELARMHARVGHEQELQSLFRDIGQRPISGPATELIQGAHEGLATFRNNPGEAYLCGPNALRNILITLKASPEQIKVAQDARSGSRGVSLEELAALAEKANLDYTLIRREPGQPIPVPSIIHWNVNHYAAIIGTQGSLYRVADPTFGSGAGLLLAARAIDEESSGYFLIPTNVNAAFPANGWRSVSANSEEAKAVYGMGTISADLPGATTTSDTCTSCKTNQGGDSNSAPQMTIANAHLATVNLNLTDTPVGYQPQKGGSARTTLSYNAREAEQPANFGFSNVSSKWTHSWLAYIEDDPNNPGNAVTRIASGGGGYDYSLVQDGVNGMVYDSTTGGFTPETYDNSQLFRYPAKGPATSYVRYMPGGSKEVYALPNGATSAPRLMFLTQVVDPAGNATTLSYDGTLRLTSITDAMGRKTTFQYGLSTAPLLITAIIDPFGRSSKLTYDTEGRLSSITDPIGITSIFTYGSASEPNFITALTTPYGTSKFSDTLNPNDPQPYFARSLAMTDPLGYVDFLYFQQDQSLTGTPSNETVTPSGMSNDNSLLEWRNTYYWNRHASANGGVSTDANGNPTAENWADPTIYHWLHFCCSYTYASNQLGSVKKPLEEYREWFNYPGMATSGYYYFSGTLIKPSATGRVLDDGTTQLTRATYNRFGLPLTTTDATHRTTRFAYATNSIDLLTVEQLTATPSTYTTIATFANYNSQHEPQSYTGPDEQTWQYNYNSAGQLSLVTDPKSEKTTYNYDTLGRLSTVVDANNKTILILTYDSADRVLTRTDSEGYVLTYAYDALDRVVKITYPDGSTDRYDYHFQSGPNVGNPSLDLRKYTDRLGRTTTYNYDADRRLISKTEPLSAGKTRTTSFDYYEDGTLKDIIDANGNDTHWDIDLQSRPTSKTYAFGTSLAQTETYAYETTNSRLHSVTDALGQVKAYTYAHDNRILDITYTGAINSTPSAAFTWDPYFPRLNSMTDGLGTTSYSYTPIGSNGALQLASTTGQFSKNDTIDLNYDALGRLAQRNLAGGNEGFSYDSISRLIQHGTPMGNFVYTYLGETDQTTSRSLTNNGVAISTSWGYDTNINDRRLIAINNSGTTRSYTLSYTNNGQTNPYDILSITDTAATGHPFQSQTHTYTYDQADRLLAANATMPEDFSYSYDSLDNATTVTTPTGTTDPTYNALNQIDTWGPLDYSYDADGNLLSGDGVHTYKWDAENRLVEIDYVGSTAKSQFSYDGLGHRTVDVETSATGTISTMRYLWCGARVCQTRDAADGIIGRDLNEGENSLTSGALIYMQDQLGSVRDVLSATNGSLIDSYDYSPYGAPNKSYGSTPPDYRYGGLFLHQVSRLNLSATRPQDVGMLRWLNRDTIGEFGGLNLYGYVGANAIGRIDPWGLCAQPDKKAKCRDLLSQIFSQYGKLMKEIDKYDPDKDAIGGFEIPAWKGGGLTRPGGHYDKIRDLQKGLRNRIQAYQDLDCEDDDTGDGGGTGPIPDSVMDAATMAVQPPNYQEGPITIPQAPSIPWWAPIIPVIPWILRMLPAAAL
jgi:RHS repeat-associated protein